MMNTESIALSGLLEYFKYNCFAYSDRFSTPARLAFPTTLVDMLALGGSIYEVTGTVERSEAIGGTLEQ